MQNEPLNSNIELATEIIEPRNAASPPGRSDECPRHRQPRMRMALPRRHACLKRAMIAALREAELSEWMATGGDFLSTAGSVRFNRDNLSNT